MEPEFKPLPGEFVPARNSAGSQWIILVLFLIVVGGGFLRFYGLGSESLWLDEVISYNDSQRPILKLLFGNFLPGEPNHNGAFYFILLRLVTWISSGESALRFLSALFGSLTIILIYQLCTLLIAGRRGQRFGLYSAVLLALSPFHLHFSQSVRGYSLLALLSVGAMIFQVRALLFKETRDFLGFIISSILLYHTHFLTIIFIGGQFLVVLWYFLFNAENRSSFARSWGFSYLILFAGIWKIFLGIRKFFVRAQLPADDRWWLTQLHESPGWSELIGLIKVFAVGFIPSSNSLNHLFFLLPVLFLAGFFPWKARGYFRTWEWSLGAFLFLIPIIINFSFSQFENFFQAKYLLFTLPVFYIMAARGLLMIPVRVLPEIVLALSLVAPAFAIHRIHTVTENPDWRGAMANLISSREFHDVVAIHANYTHILFGYYTRNIPSEVKPPSYTMQNYSGRKEDTARERARIRREFSQLSQRYQRMWLVLSFTWDTDPLNLVETEAVSRYPAILYWPGPPRIYLFQLK